MKTTWSKTMKEWYAAAFYIQESLGQFQKHRQTRNPVRRPRPVSTADRISRDQVPRMVPNYNPKARRVDPHQAEQLRSYLSCHASDVSSPHSPLTSDDLLVCLDSGGSVAVTNEKNDFVGAIHPCQFGELKGIASNLKIEGVGQVEWHFLDSDTQERFTMKLTCLYVPTMPIRILPPQQLSINGSPSNGAFISSGG